MCTKVENLHEKPEHTASTHSKDIELSHQTFSSIIRCVVVAQKQLAHQNAVCSVQEVKQTNMSLQPICMVSVALKAWKTFMPTAMLMSLLGAVV